MVMFKKKKSGYLDLGKKLEKQQAKLESFKDSEPEEIPAPAQESNSSGFFGGFFGGSAQASEIQTTQTSSLDERREKLRNRIKQMSQKLDEQEKEIYNLKQRLEVLERKQRIGY